MSILRHKSIRNTMMYIQLINFETDKYTTRVAHSLDEDKELIETGFEYIIESDSFGIYRKRK